MDDLLGEDWQQKPTSAPNINTASNASAFASTYSSFRASPQLPLSGTASPSNISRPSSTVNSSTKGSSSAGKDTFGNLLSLKSQKADGGNVSMLQRQQELLEEKRRQQEQTAQLWDTLGSGRSTPALRQPSPAAGQDDEDDVLAAFNKDAPVNTASHWAPPPPSVPASGGISGRSTPAVAQASADGAGASIEDDDDPFGLGGLPKRSNGHVTVPAPAPISNNDEDNVLGDLAKPVSAKSPPPPQLQRRDSADEPMLGDTDDMGAMPPVPEEDDSAPTKDRALAELVDMGFPPDTAKIALAETGGNVQNAVGWLLQQAHEESRQKARGDTPSREQRSPVDGPRSPERGKREPIPAWMRSQDNSRPSSATRQAENASGEKDATQVAQEYGSKFLKSANSLWKASQKQMAKTISDFQQDGVQRDPNQPKWMRDGSTDPPQPRRQPLPPKQEPPSTSRVAAAGLTDEATALDVPRERPQKPPPPSAQPTEFSARRTSPVEPRPHRPSSQPKFMQQAPPQTDRRPATKLSRQEVDDQTAQAYVSPARRKRPTPQPAAEPKPPEAEVDLFSSAPPKPKPTAPAPSKAQQTTPKASPAPPPKPKPSPRSIPIVSPAALQTSASHRKAGGEHFKRGDYASAHDSYTAALTPLPPSHPLAIIVLSNRSLTALKTGDAKVAVSDADQALSIIGPGLGAGEAIELGGGEGAKDMREFYGKALMRKAEALEHMEKYADAAAVWKQAVEAGVGGTVSLKGRDRCERAATPQPAAPASKPTPRVPAKVAPPSKSPGNSQQRPTLPTPSSAEAVKKLRQANADASKEEDEKFALSDSVDAKLAAWRGGKTDNLRALLQSMDLVLWPEAGWKKVGMSDLVMPAKVKIVYMKAIGKVHPDKIPQDATTEQRMISAAVFSTLNESWDKFKAENNL